MDRQSNCFNILELYSGIGGFHFAIKDLFNEKNIKYHLTAIDINTSANKVYRLNHSNHDDNDCRLLEQNIEKLSNNDLDQMNLDLLTMSPPCQPFSRLGNQLDLDDNRCSSFKHIINLLPMLSNKPRYLILENVKGFETSDAHHLLMTTLKKCQYNIHEFLLSPDQFGVPNSRLRYYLLAKYESNNKLINNNCGRISTKIPIINANQSIFNDENDQIEYYTNDIHLKETNINFYLEKNISDDDLNQYKLSDKQLLRYHRIIDIVDPRISQKTNCFTKSYGHRLEGCGSILKMSNEYSIEEIFAQIQSTDDEAVILKLLRKLQLRLFTPKEIANLMCFPSHLEFPSEFHRKQCYRLLVLSLSKKMNLTVQSVNATIIKETLNEFRSLQSTSMSMPAKINNLRFEIILLIILSMLTCSLLLLFILRERKFIYKCENNVHNDNVKLDDQKQNELLKLSVLLNDQSISSVGRLFGKPNPGQTPKIDAKHSNIASDSYQSKQPNFSSKILTMKNFRNFDDFTTTSELDCQI